MNESMTDVATTTRVAPPVSVLGEQVEGREDTVFLPRWPNRSGKSPKDFLKGAPCYVQGVPRVHRWATCTVALAAVGAVACNGSNAVLNQQAQAHLVAARLRVEFARAAEASNRAVMADTDEASRDAAHEAEQATKDVERDLAAMRPLADRDETELLDRFTERFARYRELDAQILPLSVENTNIKAQRLSFGPVQAAVDAVRQSLDAAGKLAPPKTATAVDALIARATAAVLEIQVIEARHIAESNEAAMTRMESAMKASETSARQAIDTLTPLLPPAAAPQLASARTALDRLIAANTELVALSRRNSNVRSLALSLGKKRAVTAECDELLQQLEDLLARHHFTATR
jgi:hypothetical protein